MTKEKSHITICSKVSTANVGARLGPSGHTFIVIKVFVEKKQKKEEDGDGNRRKIKKERGGTESRRTLSKVSNL